MDDVFTMMVRKWPSAVVSRKEVAAFSGGMIKAGTLANLDSRRLGPKERVLLGTRKVAYPATALADWLRSRTTLERR